MLQLDTKTCQVCFVVGSFYLKVLFFCFAVVFIACFFLSQISVPDLDVATMSTLELF